MSENGPAGQKSLYTLTEQIKAVKAYHYDNYLVFIIFYNDKTYH